MGLAIHDVTKSATNKVIRLGLYLYSRNTHGRIGHGGSCSSCEGGVDGADDDDNVSPTILFSTVDGVVNKSGSHQ
jgi:hypothetical protein